jgi:hypothetical protein
MVVGTGIEGAEPVGTVIRRDDENRDVASSVDLLTQPGDAQSR